MLIGLGQTFLDFSKEVRVEYRYTAYSGGNTSFRSFSSVDIGTPSSERIVVITLSGYRDIGFTNTVVINGVTATQLISGGTLDSCGIYAAKVPTGTIVTVTVSSSTNVDAIRIFAYSIYGLDAYSKLSSGFSESVSGNPSLSITNTKSNCVIIYVSSNRGTAGSFSYSGVSTVNSSEGAANATDIATGATIINSISGTLTSTYSSSRSYHKLAYAIIGV